MPSKRSVMPWIGAFAMCLGLMVSAHAQQPGAAPDVPQKEQKLSKTGQAETIVVTATKREEDVTKVPISVTVISGDTLEEQHIVDFTDLTRSVPNLSFSGGAAGGGSGIPGSAGPYRRMASRAPRSASRMHRRPRPPLGRANRRP